MLSRIRLSAALLAGLVCGSAQAQAPKPDASPLAPGDLKRPIFDTMKPIYGDKKDQSADTVVAEVDGRAVTLGEVGDAVRELPATVAALPFVDLYPNVLEQLVRQQALVLRAQRQGLDTDPVVRRRMKAASDRVLANELLRQEITRSITEQALLDRYNKDIAGKPGPEEVHVRVIMEPTEAAAQGVIGELRAGADFAALAKRSSQDTTASIGGDLGFVARDGLNAEISAAAFALPAGEITPFPVRSNGGWFVVKVEERRSQPTPAFSVVREQLVQAMLREGVPDVVKKALADVAVTEYSVSGKPPENLPSDHQDQGDK